MNVATAWTPVLVASTMLLPTAPRAQMPPQPGKLVISSEPTGAVVTINGQKMSQPTNAVFAVSAGTYKVSVSSADGVLSCAELTLSVSGGQTAARQCTPKGWQ
jgi:PEGA domain